MQHRNSGTGPIILGLRGNDLGQRQKKDPPVIQNPTKKLLGNKKIVPRITIRVDELIRETYVGLSTGKLLNVTDSPAVLNNDALIDYIRAIYQTYDLEDPLNKYRRVSSNSMSITHRRQSDAAYPQVSHFQLTPSRKTEQRSLLKNSQAESTIQKTHPQRDRSSSKKKIQQLKESIRNGVNNEPIEVRKISLSTTKKSSSQNIKRKIMYGTPQKDEKPVTSESIMHSQELRRQPTHRMSQANAEPRSEHMLLHRQRSEIQPTFRFCFLCQNPIMQANISSHQRKCPHFLELYRLNCEEIVGMLVEKISRMKRQIRMTMHQCARDALNNVADTEDDLKLRVEQWMKSVEHAQLNGMIFGREYEHSYEQIRRVLDRKCFRLFELTHKLKWFLKMRENIKSRFHI